MSDATELLGDKYSDGTFQVNVKTFSYIHSFLINVYYFKSKYFNQKQHEWPVKNTRGRGEGGRGSWLNSLGLGFWLRKDILGFFKSIDLDNS